MTDERARADRCERPAWPPDGTGAGTTLTGIDATKHAWVTGARAAWSLFVACTAVPMSASAARVDIHGPPGSIAFGATTAVLPNGNIVVVDSEGGPGASVGAVYLYHANGGKISVITGSTANDRVGDGGITVLRNGNFVIRSPDWNNGSALHAGAATWVDGEAGLNGTVSPANSLVGTHVDDFVGAEITTLANGNYVVASFR